MTTELSGIYEIMVERLELAGITMTTAEKDKYIKSADDLGPISEVSKIPTGYKKCGRCEHVLKFYLFNKNKGSKTNTTGNCKECQKETAAKSYSKTKKKRNYRKYYQENKERKQEHARKYYKENKDEILAKQKEYHTSSRGRKVMRNAHKKRRNLIKHNQGIPYTREMIIDRDKLGKEFPICYICGNPVEAIDKSLHLDHVIPIAIGGLDCFSNIGCTHDQCNLTKKKDGSDVTADQIQYIVGLSEQYMDENPELFECMADDDTEE